MTAPDNVVAGFAYNVSTSKTVPLRSQYYLSQIDNNSLWPIPDFVAGYGTPDINPLTAGAVSLTAPVATFRRF